MSLRHQFSAGETQRLFQPAQLLIAGRITDPSGFDEGKIRLGNPGFMCQFIQRQPQPPPPLPKFFAQGFHVGFHILKTVPDQIADSVQKINKNILQIPNMRTDQIEGDIF